MDVLHKLDVDNAVKCSAGGIGELNVHYFAAEGLFHGVLYVIPVGLVSVQLVYSYDHRQLLGLGPAHEALGADFHALLGVDYQDAALAHAESRISTADEIVGTGGVDDVDFAACELCVERSRINGTLVDFLKLVAVGQGVLVFDGAHSGDNFALEEHGLRKSGLAGLGSAEQNYVADLFGLVFFHCIRCC